MVIRLVVFDVDGTLTQHSSIWWRLHEVFGTTKEGKEYYNLFFEGKLDYNQWAELDAGLWKGKPMEIVKKVVKETKLVPGAKETIQKLHEAGIYTAILSGGLDVLAEDIAKRLGIDYVLTNRLVHQNGMITGEVEVKVGWGEKVHEIEQIAEHFGTILEQTAFVGDGRNDIGVMKVVGLAIAFLPETDAVANAADVVIRVNDLRAILPHILGQS